MVTIESTENIASLEKQWIEAKEAESGWNKHRLLLEGRTLELVPQETFVTELPDKGTVRLDQLDITFGQTRAFNQGKLAALIADFPWLLQTLFRVEYKINSNPTLNKFIAEDDNEGVGQRLLECFEDKPNKPSFKKR